MDLNFLKGDQTVIRVSHPPRVRCTRLRSGNMRAMMHLRDVDNGGVAPCLYLFPFHSVCTTIPRILLCLEQLSRRECMCLLSYLLPLSHAGLPPVLA